MAAPTGAASLLHVRGQGGIVPKGLLKKGGLHHSERGVSRVEESS